MKTHVWKSEFSVLSSSLRRLLLSILMVVISSRAYGQSSALTECTRAFYRGDYALAVQLAEKHLRKYPKDVPVRVALARAELAQGKPLQAFEELRRALESDPRRDRKSTRLNSSHGYISYAVFCLKKNTYQVSSDWTYTQQ